MNLYTLNPPEVSLVSKVKGETQIFSPGYKIEYLQCVYTYIVYLQVQK